MRQPLNFFGIALFLLLSAIGAWAAPINDSFSTPIALAGPVVTTTGSNVGATRDFFSGEPFITGNPGGANVWWTWRASASGQTTIDTSGSSFNTLLGVYTGNAGNQLAIVGENNDYNGNTWSRVQFNAVAGTLYRIQVDGLRSGGGFGSVATGIITLNIHGVGGLTVQTPTNGMVFTVGDPIPVNVTIDSDFPNPPASRVDFYRGGTLFASVSNAPFNTVAIDSPAGSNNFYVVAVDNTGAPIQSSVITVFVQSIGVTLLAPAQDTVFLNTNPIPVSAWAYLPAGSITNIEFFVDGLKFGEDATPPFSVVWSNVVGGSHRLTAVGKSDTGVAYNSQPVNIGVSALLVHSNSVWKYLDDGSNQGTNWITPAYDDSTWASGPAELGYGDGDEATVVHSGPTNNFYITTYFRRSFVASNVAGISNLFVLLAYDDGGAVYLNGTEIYRTANLPTNAIFSTVTTGQAIEETVDTATRSAASLIEGTNVLAVEIHQQAATSSDISFFLQLSGIPRIIHNLSPTVTLTGPTNGAYFLAPPSVALTATADDADGSVAKVEFYADGVKVGETTNSPYSSSWSNPSVGPHSLTAIAVDDQGARTESAAVTVIVYDAVGTPYVQITSPADGTAVEGGTNQVITAFANAQHGVTNVQFLSNGSVIGADATSPFGVVWNAPFGTNALTAVAFDVNGFRGTSAVVRFIAFPNTTPPTIVTQSPPRGSVISNFTSLAVTFSERVQNVDAGDLLVSGIPATGVTGSGSNYVFTFPQPFYGEAEIAWANGHGITDFGYPSNLPFNELSPDAQWDYDLIDKTPPTLVVRTPVPGSTVTNLAQISVTFSELVTNVDASDLLVNGTAALAVSGGGANYTFSVLQPAAGTVNITWATNHGILDLAETPNAFVGTGTNAAWSFTLDTRVVLVQSNSNWRFVKGFGEASTPTTAWRQPAFDDSSWSNSQAPFFFGDPYTNYPAGIFGTQLSDMRSNYTTIFLRQPFVVQNRGTVTNLLINYQSDDGFIAWLNGVEVFRFNVPTGEPTYTTTASAAATEPNNVGAAYIVATLTNAAVSRLVNGTNILTVQAFNQTLTDGDFGFNAQVYYLPVDITLVPPRIVAAEPAGGELFYLTNVTMNFSEGVSGVDAADLLINGTPATGVSSTTNATYTFSFPQPAYGTVLVTWATNHGIADFDSPPKAFVATAASATVSYTLLNPSSPRIVTQTPLASTTITGLTSITLTFTEPVAGVDASDLLISGNPATSVASADNTTFTFSFPQPAFGTVSIRWATNHGITDIEIPPAAFDPTRFGGQWNYTLINPVPSVSLTSPTNNTFVLAPADVLLRATASDNDGTVALVEFYKDASKVGDATNSPYSMILSNTPASTYVFRAVATDNTGLRGTSAPVVLNVVTSLPVVLLRGPYLQMGSTTGAVVRWRSDLFSDGLVYYGTDAANLTNLAVQTIHTNEHIVTMSGLQPDTKYYYSIGTSSQRLAGTNGPGSDYWFKTSPPVGTRRPLRFWVLGDSGTANANAANVRDAYYRLAATNGPADFWLMLGDNAYQSGLDTEYQSAVFDFYPATLRNLFLWPAIGNHESNQSFTSEDYPYLNIFSLPHNAEAGGVPSGSQKYYSFDYANIHFTCLDSMTSGRTTNTAMVQWLMNDLASTAQQWLIVFFHHPPYTKGNHNSDTETELIEIRQNILPILEANGVDLVLCGHSHAVERSYLLHGHYGFLGEMTNASLKIDGGSGRVDGTGAYRKNSLGQGTVYNVAGSSGQITGGTLNDPANFISLNELGSLVIDVNGGRLDVKCLGTNGNSVDYYTLVKDQLPAVPVSLVARALDGNDVALSWADLGTNELGFVLERSTDGIDFTRFVTNAVNTTNALDGGLVANATYFYRIRSFNEGGESKPSAVSSVTTVTALAVPIAPSGLAASAGGGTESYRSQIVLRWRDRSANEAGFLIERSGDGSAFSPLGSVGANVTLYVDQNLASASTYYYRVRSFNALGDSAPSSPSDDQTYPQDNLVTVGDTATFHAGQEGAPPIRYQWSFLGAAIPGATNEALTITNAQPANEGPYTVAVTDAAGATVSNPAWLFVLAPPVIVQSPASRTNVAGLATSFQVVAQGTAPLYYQWRKDGVNLSGANGAEFDIVSVAMSDQANYDVLVGNGLGTATSQVARLVVNQAPLAGVDHLEGFQGQTLAITIADLLSNDSDPDGDALTITRLSSNSAQGATISLVGQSVTYSPSAGLRGDDSFTYTLTDARGASVVGLVTVYLSFNTRPLVSVIPDQVANVLTPLIVSNLATDLDVPANKLTFSLDPGGPTNAAIGAKTGIFSFTPRRDQAHTTNTFTVRVADDGRPPLSNSVSFNVAVNDYIETTAGTVVMYAGDNNSVPLDVYCGVDLSNLQCALQFNGARLTNFTVENLVPQLATVSLQQPDTNTAALTFTALPGHTLQGTQHLAQLHFTAPAGQTTAFVPLHFLSASGTTAVPGLTPGVLVNDGRVVVVGSESMVEPVPPVAGQRTIMLYGRKGTNYVIEYSTNLASGGPWTTRGTISLTTTNFRSVAVGNTVPPPIFYRARQ